MLSMSAATTGPLTGIDQWHFDPPKEVLQSRLFEASGYMVITGLFDAETLRAMRVEADGVRVQGHRGFVAESDGTEGRGGSPGRAFRSGAGGDIHFRLHGCQQMAKTLGGLCGVTVSSTGGGSYSYYEQAGDFLALHRDVLQCDIAIITSLTKSIVDGSAGELVVYPRFIREPLSTVRKAGRTSGTFVPLDRGQTVILLGGIVPHEVAPICAGQERIVAINCYRVQRTDSRN
jgi:hypothetical protein